MSGHRDEFTLRIGDGTPFAATLTCVPVEDDAYVQWRGYIQFDDNTYNWPEFLSGYDGATMTIYEPWCYPRDVAAGTYMANLLTRWHGDIVAFIERMKQL